MKKIVFMFLVLLFALPSFGAMASEELVVLYAPDGREISVPVSEVEAYLNVGWYESQVKIMFADDGRTLVVKTEEVDAHKKVGWYETKQEVMRTVYAPDGRTLEIYRAETEAYKNVGWFENESDVKKLMYAPDGRTIEVYISEVELYKSVGWYDDIDYATSVMCAPDGRKITIYNSEVDDYINVGWSKAQGNKIDPSKPMVALTFDDGPMPSSTGRILNVLDNYNARATFFVVGSMAVNAPEMLVKMNEIGCQIGNHSYNHPDLSTLSSYGIANEINSTSDIVFGAVGKYPTVLRPPYGSQNWNVLQSAGMPSIIWSIDTNDWRYRNANHVINVVLSNVSDGDIILMHDVYGTTADAVDAIVPSLVSMGFQLVTIDELAYYKNIALTPGNSYSDLR